MSRSDPERLSDVDIHVHGMTQDDVIQNRKAGKKLMNDAANRGNRICEQARHLDMLASAFGVDSTFGEDMDDDVDF